LNPDWRIVAFVHAKGHSERLPHKNLRILGGVPLVCHAIRNALQARRIDAVVIDSEDHEILAVGEAAGAIPLARPLHLADNNTTGDDLAYWQAQQLPQAHTIIQAVPTSPFISPQSYDSAIELLRRNKLDAVVGTRTESLYTWRYGRPDYLVGERTPNSQDLRPTTYETTGLYVMRRAFVLTTRRRINPNNCAAYALSRIEAIDINTLRDLDFAQLVWRGLQSQPNNDRKY